MTATAKKVLTYLLVEDDEGHANLIRECIQHGDLSQNVRQVASGVDGLHYLNGETPFSDREMYPYPDVVLLDIRMPGELDGLQTLQIIRADQRHRGLAVMILTTSDREEDVNRAYELGVNGYIVKSGDISHMIEQLLWVRWSFDSLIRLPEHRRQPAINGAAQANTMPPSDTAGAFLVSNEDTALNMLVSSYRENRNEFVELLVRLENLDVARFARLARNFSLLYNNLLVGPKEVDWNFIRRVIMEKLPNLLTAQQMSEVAESISAAMKDKPFCDEDSPRLHVWREFRRNCASRIPSPGQVPSAAN